jgi:hypothetical protein
MGVRKVITCDLCGTEDLGNYLVIRAKQFWESWWECGFYRRKIYICEGCQKRLKAAAVYSREKEEN